MCIVSAVFIVPLTLAKKGPDYVSWVDFITIPPPVLGTPNTSLATQFQLKFRIFLGQPNMILRNYVSRAEGHQPNHRMSLDLPIDPMASFETFLDESQTAGFTLRTSPVWANPVGHFFFIRHPAVAIGTQRFRAGWHSADSWGSATATQLWRYMLCLWCHVFVDGNGRIARRFLASALHDIGTPNRLDFQTCSIFADEIHLKIRDALVIMESQNCSCWLTGLFEILHNSLDWFDAPKSIVP